jgi:hypothetical protein
VRIVVGPILIVHGFARLGHTGIRTVGILWFIAAMTFAASGVGLVTLQQWWRMLTLVAALFDAQRPRLAGLPHWRVGQPDNPRFPALYGETFLAVITEVDGGGRHA